MWKPDSECGSPASAFSVFFVTRKLGNQLLALTASAGRGHGHGHGFPGSTLAPVLRAVLVLWAGNSTSGLTGCVERGGLGSHSPSLPWGLSAAGVFSLEGLHGAGLREGVGGGCFCRHCGVASPEGRDRGRGRALRPPLCCRHCAHPHVHGHRVPPSGPEELSVHLRGHADEARAPQPNRCQVQEEDRGDGQVGTAAPPMKWVTRLRWVRVTVLGRLQRQARAPSAVG